MVAEKRRKERLDALRKSEEDKKEYNDFKIQISAKVQKRVQNWSRVSDNGKKLKSLFNLLNTIHLDMPELVLKPLPGARKVVKQNLDDDPFGYNSNRNNNMNNNNNNNNNQQQQQMMMMDDSGSNNDKNDGVSRSLGF